MHLTLYILTTILLAAIFLLLYFTSEVQLIFRCLFGLRVPGDKH